MAICYWMLLVCTSTYRHDTSMNVYPPTATWILEFLPQFLCSRKAKHRSETAAQGAVALANDEGHVWKLRVLCLQNAQGMGHEDHWNISMGFPGDFLKWTSKYQMWWLISKRPRLQKKKTDNTTDKSKISKKVPLPRWPPWPPWPSVYPQTFWPPKSWSPQFASSPHHWRSRRRPGR